MPPVTKKDIGQAEILARELNRQLYDRAVEAAEAMGAPPGKTKLTSEQEYQYYWLADPSVDVADLVVNQGLSPEEATLKKYPHRASLLVSGKPKLVDRVAYATRMRQLREQRMADAADENPEPETPHLDRIETLRDINEPTIPVPPPVDEMIPTEAIPPSMAAPPTPGAGMMPADIQAAQQQGVV